MRFELAGELMDERARVERATQRASTIVANAFDPGDDAFAVFIGWRTGEDSGFLSLLPRGARVSAGRDTGIDFYRDGHDFPYVRLTAAVNPYAFDVARLLRMTANADLALSPSLDGRTYLVNATRGLIFHMYDDRGAIVIGATPAALRTLRMLGKWIIERGSDP